MGGDALEGLRHMQAGEASCSESGLFIYCIEADPLQGFSWVHGAIAASASAPFCGPNPPEQAAGRGALSLGPQPVWS